MNATLPIPENKSSQIQHIEPTAYAPLGVHLRVYRALTRALTPLASLVLSHRERRGKEDPARRGERQGRPAYDRPDAPLVWAHAASVGETNAILPLLSRMAVERPDLCFLLTTGTVTSARLAEQRLGERAVHQYVPLDTPRYAASFLDHWRPDLAIFTESDIWPNLILEAASRQIPLTLVNGRMSKRSYDRWRRNAAISVPLFGRFALVVAQNDALSSQFAELGASNVMSAGNLKADAPAPPVDSADLLALERAIGGRTVFVAASTHEGEEEIIAAAHREMARGRENLLTIIAPRHPERGTPVAEKLKTLGLRVVQRSTGTLPDPATDVYIADTIGELGLFYSVSDVVLIGGSLVPHGGQNPIEAIRHGAAVLVGRETRNFPDVYRALETAGGVTLVADATDLAASAARLLANPAQRATQKIAAEAALATLSGALDRTFQALRPWLPPELGADDSAATAVARSDRRVHRRG
ncbi:MAG: 3-deoxy-D-manno-octulosonic acid transferase [Hyphomicrobium sp.]|nr:3-deoxy-D-manno-octulosonic acid transferase [Hyphomicrobium sp.]